MKCVTNASLPSFFFRTGIRQMYSRHRRLLSLSHDDLKLRIGFRSSAEDIL